MKIENIGISISFASLTNLGKGTDASLPMNTAVNTDGASSVSVGQDARRFSSIEDSRNADNSLSMVAANIRFADNTMKSINSDIIEKMKEQLGTIVKQYPPYPPGSEERVKFLKEYIGLRKQIEQLTIPPEYQFAGKILSAPAQSDNSGDQTVSLGKVSVTIRNQSVSAGSGGLKIPELTTDSSDAEVAAAYRKLSDASVSINAKQEGLAADAQALARSIEFKTFPTDVTEQDALERSTSVRNDLSRNSLPITDNRSLSAFI